MKFDLINQLILLIPLFIASVIDVKKKDISMLLILICGALSLFTKVIPAVFSGDPQNMTELILSVSPGLMMLLISRISGQSLGYGDGLMALAVGPIFGFEKMALGLMIALFLSSILSIALLVAKKAGKKTTIPFLPFITLGMGVMTFA
jgi:leader peptidase (prepilin peptidase)/N-methyltransferase